MKKLVPCLAFVALAACGSEEPAPAPTATAVATPAAASTPSLAPPTEADFAAAFAAGCPSAEKVSTSLCKSQGLGKAGFTCQYGLGDDEYRRHTATLMPGDNGKWALQDPENACVAG